MNIIKALVTTALIVPAVALLSFGPKPASDRSGGRVVVDYWEKWTGVEEAQMRQIVNDFNESVGAEKGIYVRYLSASNITQKTLLSTAAGVPPDVAGLWDRNVFQFAALDALEPLDDLAREHNVTEAMFKPAYWKALTTNNHLYGVVSSAATIALHYNKRIFAEKAGALRAAGLDPTRPPRTIAELDAYGDALTERDASGHIVRAGYLPMEPGWFVNDTGVWFGANYWDDQARRFTLTAPGVVDAFNWIQGYSRRLGRGAVSEFQSSAGNFDSPQNAFMTGAVAMEQQGPWMANIIYNAKPAMSTVRWSREEEMTKPLAERLTNYEWAVAPFPSAVPGKTNVSIARCDVLVIPHGAKHKKEAFEFLAYVSRQDVMEKLSKLHGSNSPLARVSDDFLQHHPNPYISVFETLAASPDTMPPPNLPLVNEAAEEMTNLIQRVVLMQVEPEQGLAEAQKTLQAKYDQFIDWQNDRHKSVAVAVPHTNPN